ncbi:MAG: EscU/YscU/HrcU family type III secretion system export apparatus switch protein [Proteobacteria bacterium]|nr:EscU/YscU/HrcU family type III secretion system export apparatus switch protein [Pseudomonadota bacterium]
MADKESRTEEATPKRRAKLRSEGKIARSQDLTAVATLIGAAFALYFMSASLGSDVIAFAIRSFRLQDADRPLQALAVLLPVFSGSVLPVVFVAAAVTGIVSGFQTGWLFQPNVLRFKLERFNPLPALQRMLPTKETLIEILKSFAKMVLVGVVAYMVLNDAIPSFFVLAMIEPIVAAATVGAAALKLALYAISAFVLLAIVDYRLVKRKFEEDAKMSKQEVSDEKRQAHGDVQVKGKVRQRMREVARRRAVADVKHATVLVTNPTHVSVALRYEADGDSAPTVVSKGIDDVALQMRAAARSYGVPIVENRPLARAMHGSTKVGHAIPVELYAATAQVIAHVLRLRGGLR